MIGYASALSEEHGLDVQMRALNNIGCAEYTATIFFLEKLKDRPPLRDFYPGDTWSSGIWIA